MLPYEKFILKQLKATLLQCMVRINNVYLKCIKQYFYISIKPLMLRDISMFDCYLIYAYRASRGNTPHMPHYYAVS